MTYITKPKLHHPQLPANKLGFTRRDYEGAISTLCANWPSPIDAESPSPDTPR